MGNVPKYGGDQWLRRRWDPPDNLKVPPASLDNITKALLPYLSPEDASSIIRYKGWGEGVPPSQIPSQMTGQMRNYYLSRGRAEQALAAMDAAVGKSTTGPGYAFLKNVVSLLDKFGGSPNQGMTRQAFNQFANAVQGILNLAKSDSSVSDYASLAVLFSSPSFTAGELMPSYKAGGRTFYTPPNPKLFS